MSHRDYVRVECGCGAAEEWSFDSVIGELSSDSRRREEFYKRHEVCFSPAATPSAGGNIQLRYCNDDLSGYHSAATADIERERVRQICDEGWSPEHDDEHSQGELAAAAAAYAHPHYGRDGGDEPWPDFWPWHPAWWKPKDRRRNLVRAAALIIAEIERLDRAAARQVSEEDSTKEG